MAVVVLVVVVAPMVGDFFFSTAKVITTNITAAQITINGINHRFLVILFTPLNF